MTLKRAACGLLCAVLMAGGCSKREDSPKDASQTPPQTPGAPQAAVAPGSAPVAVPGAQALQAAPETGLTSPVQSMDPQKLKELLPETLAGMKRTDLSGEKIATMGMDMSHADARYEAPEGQAGRLNITITDAGSASNPIRMGLTSWAANQYSRETDNGYEKTITYKGQKGFEQVDRSSKQASLRLFVADRFVLEVEGSDTTIETVKQAADGLDLTKLASLAGK